MQDATGNASPLTYTLDNEQQEGKKAFKRYQSHNHHHKGHRESSGSGLRCKKQSIVRRNLKDIIVISNTCGCYMFNMFNGIPVKEYNGDKSDISFFSLTRYLKQIKDVPDVRVKIMEDFYPLLNLP